MSPPLASGGGRFPANRATPVPCGTGVIRGKSLAGRRVPAALRSAATTLGRTAGTTREAGAKTAWPVRPRSCSGAPCVQRFPPRAGQGGIMESEIADEELADLEDPARAPVRRVLDQDPTREPIRLLSPRTPLC